MSVQPMLPGTAAGLLRRISASHLDDWQGCRARWYERHVAKRTEQEPFIFARGRAVDVPLEALNKRRLAGQTTPPLEFTEWFVQCWELEMGQVDDPRAHDSKEQGIALAMALGLARAGREWKVVEVQEWYELALCPGWTLIGQLDLVIETADGPVILDLKTADKPWDSRKLLRQRQPALYAALYREKHGMLPAGFRFLVAAAGQGTPREIPVRLSHQTVDVALDEIRAVAGEISAALEAGHFPRGPQCRYCPWLHVGGCLPEGER